MADELRGIENGMNLLYGRTPAPLPSDMIRPEDGYQMQMDPALQQAQEPTGLSSYEQQLASGQDPFGVQGLQLGRSPMAGWYLPVEQGGLGVAGPGPEPDRQETLDEHFARRLFPNFKGELSFGDKLRLRDGMMNAIPHMASRQEQIAQQQAQLEEQGRQHDMQLLEKAMASPKANVMLEQLAQSPNFRFSKQAGMLSKGLKESDYGSMQAYLQFIPEDVQQRFMTGKLPPHELSAWIDQAREEAKTNAKEQAKVAIFQRAQNKKPEERTPYEAQLVRDREDAELVKHADISLKNAQAAKANREAAQGPPDHSEDNKIHEALNGGLPWAQGNNQTRQAALKYKSEQYAQGKANVTAGTSLSQLGKQQEFRDPVTGKAAPGWATTEQANKMGFVNIETSQIPTVNQLQNVDAALKEILAAGSTLVRQETGHGLFDIPTGMLQTPINKLITKFAGDPNAQLLMSAITRITPALSKLGGDTGNVAVEERKMYADSLFDPADTLGSFVTKIKSVKKATDRTREAMGFVPDDKSYMRRLAIMGQTDDQIKAIMEERKRMQ